MARAEFSDDRVYRYVLERGPFVGWPGSRVLFVCQNPSIATETIDDPTVRRMVGFARDWLFETLVVCNVFAYRATDPRVLREAARAGADVVGPRNDDAIRDEAALANLVIAAWGAGGAFQGRGAKVRRILEEIVVPTEATPARQLYALALTKSGEPRHPLYAPAELLPAPLSSLERAGRTTSVIAEDSDVGKQDRAL